MYPIELGDAVDLSNIDRSKEKLDEIYSRLSKDRAYKVDLIIDIILEAVNKDVDTYVYYTDKIFEHQRDIVKQLLNEYKSNPKYKRMSMDAYQRYINRVADLTLEGIDEKVTFKIILDTNNTYIGVKTDDAEYTMSRIDLVEYLQNVNMEKFEIYLYRGSKRVKLE